MKNRNQQIREDRAKGLKLEQIAAKHHITRERVRQILARFAKEEYMRKTYPDLSILPQRLRYRLIEHNLTLEKARQLTLPELTRLKGIGPIYALFLKTL